MHCYKKEAVSVFLLHIQYFLGSSCCDFFLECCSIFFHLKHVVTRQLFNTVMFHTCFFSGAISASEGKRLNLIAKYTKCCKIGVSICSD